jgi:hypothetical protein
MGKDISPGEFLSYFVTLFKGILIIIAIRALLLFFGFKQRIPVIDPFLNWLKGLFTGLSIGSPSF